MQLLFQLAARWILMLLPVWSCVQAQRYVKIKMTTNFHGYDMTKRYIHIGCFDTKPDYMAILSDPLLPGESNPNRCFMLCMERAYHYFSLDPHFCACGNSLEAVGPRVDASLCAVPPCVPGSGGSTCGADYRTDVYEVLERYPRIGCYGNVTFNAATERLNQTKMDCFLRCQKMRYSFFAMQNTSRCLCVDSFRDPLPARQCGGPCLEYRSEDCSYMSAAYSVFEIRYAQHYKELVASKALTFMPRDKATLSVKIKSATIVTNALHNGQKVYITGKYSHRTTGYRYRDFTGTNEAAKVQKCPSGWLISSKNYNYDTSRYSESDIEDTFHGYYCYKVVNRPRTWIVAARYCWERMSELFYPEMPPKKTVGFSELLWEINTRVRAGQRDASQPLLPNIWTPYYSYGAGRDNGSYVKLGRDLPSDLDPDNMTGTCRILDAHRPESDIWLAKNAVPCNHRYQFVCKRPAHPHLEWNQESYTPVPYNSKLKVSMFNYSSASVFVMGVAVFVVGPHSTKAGVRFLGGIGQLNVAAEGNVPTAICSDKGPHSHCEYMSRVTPIFRQKVSTCPINAIPTETTPRWVELASKSSHVMYYVKEVHIYLPKPLHYTLQMENRTNGKFDSRWSCLNREVYWAKEGWRRYTCEATGYQLRLFYKGRHNLEHTYFYPCDIQVYGYFVSDKSADEHQKNIRKTLASSSLEDRIIDFHFVGLFNRSKAAVGGGGPNEALVFPGATLLQKGFLFVAYLGGREFPAVQHADDHTALVLKPDQELSDLVIVAKFRLSLHSTDRISYICSVDPQMGKQACNITGTYFVRIDIKERIRLHKCKQSSRLNQYEHCGQAYDMVNPYRSRWGGCALTAVSSNPWWQADVATKSGVFAHFETVEIYADKSLTAWTKNFDIFIDRKDACASVRNGEPFERKRFHCGLYGSQIGIVARGGSVQLALCELVVHGSRAACGSWQISKSQCQGQLYSHLGHGVRPYPAGLNCQSLIVQLVKAEVLLLQFPQFGTAGPSDYVAIYAGVGTAGRRLALFYGTGERKPKYKRPDYFGPKYYIRIGNDTSQITVQFVTAKTAKGSELRTVKTHPGFILSYTTIKDDLAKVRSNDLDTPKRICYAAKYMEYLAQTCAHRGGVNPVSIYGNATGGRMLRYLEEVFNDQGRRKTAPLLVSTMEYSLGLVPFRLPSIEGDMSDRKIGLMCGTYSAARRPPRYFDECCCNYCSRRKMAKYCIYPYELATSCNVGVTVLSK